MPDSPVTTAPLLLGFLLGMRHAIDADHVVAMSAIVTRERSLMRASLLGGYWGLGHSFSILVVGLLVVLFRIPLAPSVGIALERAVGLMLVGLGAWSLIGGRRRGAPADAESPPRSGLRGSARAIGGRPFAVGMVHGLAGSGALALLVVATIPSRAAGLFIMALFGAGSIGGMMLITAILGLPMALGTRLERKATAWIPAFASVASVVFGIYYLWIST